MKTEQAVDRFIQRYLSKHAEKIGGLPTVNFDPPWPSPCTENLEQSAAHHQRVWEPRFRGDNNLFADLETGLECTLPQSLKVYYGRYWSNGICADFQAGDQDFEFQFIQIWNADDEEQLKENLLGHSFARLKGRLDLDFFIATTEGPDIVTIKYDSEEIWLGRPGKVLQQKLADNLEDFLDQCEPNLEDYD